VPVESEQAMHVYEMHHVMAHFRIESFTFFGKGQGYDIRKTSGRVMLRVGDEFALGDNT